MCGILGAKVSKTEEELEFCRKLMEQLTIRGLHSFGICYHDRNYHIHKSLEREFEKFIENFKNSNTNQFIFHNRYSTSGDWHNEKNNQPILVEEVGAIVMNGVLSMATKEEYEKLYNVKCNSDNDAEIFLQKMKQGIGIIDFLKQEAQCSFAGIFLSKNYKLFGIRNNKRPLYYYKSKYGDYLVSTLDTIRRAGGNWKEAKIVEPFKICSL